MPCVQYMGSHYQHELRTQFPDHTGPERASGFRFCQRVYSNVCVEQWKLEKRLWTYLDLWNHCGVSKIFCNEFDETSQQETSLVHLIYLLPVGLEEVPGELPAGSWAAHSGNTEYGVLRSYLILQFSVKTSPQANVWVIFSWNVEAINTLDSEPLPRLSKVTICN